MIDPQNVPPVDASELLARFLVQKSHFRVSDGTVKSDAFVPPPNLELSVNRHLDATEEETWEVGHSIAKLRGCTLRGRADVFATVFQQRELTVAADAILGNPNHAIVSNWPKDKPTRKIIAQEIAKQATFVKVD